MTKGAAYFFLLLYLAAVSKPVAPIAMDVLAHSFWEAVHISSVHHHHGDDHTHAELEMSSKHDEESPSGAKYEEPVSVHLTSQKTITSHLSFDTKNNYCCYNSSISESLKEVITPPPKA
jgi:hypothetical protein